jgi:DNA-binding MarR family transcriptional regulator
MEVANAGEVTRTEAGKETGAGAEAAAGTDAATAAGAERDGGAPCPTPEDLALLRQWDALQSGFRRLTDQVLGDVECTTGLTPSSFQVLWFLLTAPGQSAPMNHLSGTLGFTTAGTTKVVDRLSGAGLVERRPSETDRRVILAALSQAGRQSATTAALSLAGALRERVVAPLGAETFTSLARAIGSADAASDASCD